MSAGSVSLTLLFTVPTHDSTLRFKVTEDFKTGINPKEIPAVWLTIGKVHYFSSSVALKSGQEVPSGSTPCGIPCPVGPIKDFLINCLP